LKPSIPNAISITQAMESSETLHSLLSKVRLSQSRLETVKQLVPVTLRPSLQAGSADEGQWTLLVNSPAVAAKLRQLLPSLNQALRQKEQVDVEVRIKIARPTA
jgi:hypothetical protein